jgi:hypothetical protein
MLVVKKVTSHETSRKFLHRFNKISACNSYNTKSYFVTSKGGGSELTALLAEVPRLSPCLTYLSSLVHHLLR